MRSFILFKVSGVTRSLLSSGDVWSVLVLSGDVWSVLVLGLSGVAEVIDSFLSTKPLVISDNLSLKPSYNVLSGIGVV